MVWKDMGGWDRVTPNGYCVGGLTVKGMPEEKSDFRQEGGGLFLAQYGPPYIYIIYICE